MSPGRAGTRVNCSHDGVRWLNWSLLKVHFLALWEEKGRLNKERCSVYMTSDKVKGHWDCFCSVKIKKSIEDTGHICLHPLIGVTTYQPQKWQTLCCVALYYYKVILLNDNVRCEAILQICFNKETNESKQKLPAKEKWSEIFSVILDCLSRMRKDCGSCNALFAPVQQVSSLCSLHNKEFHYSINTSWEFLDMA